MPTTEEPLWENTSIQNLIRYRPSGTYFARFKVGGKLVRQSLETAVFSVAKQRLPDKVREYRSRHESVKAFAGGKMTVGDAVEVYAPLLSVLMLAPLLLVRCIARHRQSRKSYDLLVVIGFCDKHEVNPAFVIDVIRKAPGAVQESTATKK